MRNANIDPAWAITTPVTSANTYVNAIVTIARRERVNVSLMGLAPWPAIISQ
jgi:hypothetical protein